MYIVLVIGGRYKIKHSKSLRSFNICEYDDTFPDYVGANFTNPNAINSLINSRVLAFNLSFSNVIWPYAVKSLPKVTPSSRKITIFVP